MNLNDLEGVKNIDTGRFAESLVLFPEQIKRVWHEAEKVKVPKVYSQADKIILFGMGGSNLGARIIASVFKDNLKIPLIIEAGYEVPNFVNKKTLCILSSYSGTTEEVLSVFQELKKRQAKILAIGISSNNSVLEELSRKNRIVGLFFGGAANPSGQPRAGLGYTMFGVLALLNKAGVLRIKQAEIKSLIEKLNISGKNFDIDVKNNPAKVLAQKIYGHGAVLLGGSFLEGNLHALRNQFNENSKNFSAYLVLPDMNHYAMEGLSFPESIKKDFVFLVFNSNLYHPRISRRLELTKQVIKKNKGDVLEYSLVGKSKLEQALELLQFGGWVTFYLGILNGINPSLIPWVDWFKKELEK